jgi:hypothetical protein
MNEWEATRSEMKKQIRADQVLEVSGMGTLYPDQTRACHGYQTNYF